MSNKVKVICEDGRTRTAHFTGEADSFFSRPAKISTKDKTVSGFVAVRDGKSVFIATQKWRHAFGELENGNFHYKLNEVRYGGRGFVQKHDLVKYEDDSGIVGFARVVERVYKDGLGRPIPAHKVWFKVWTIDTELRHAYVRFIELDNITKVLETEGVEFLANFFGPNWDPEQAESLSRIGAYNKSYFSRYKKELNNENQRTY